MPQRTNDFQELVTLVQESLVPLGAKVTPSAMVPSPNSGAMREIDILIETSVGPYAMKIAVEAKDEGRRLDATKMEAIIGKYRGRGGLLVNKVVVVAHRGFTEEATNRARDEDIELLTLDEAKLCNWCRSTLPKEFHYHSDPMPYSIEIDPPLPSDIDRAVAMKEGHFVCRCHGHDKGAVMAHMFGILHRLILPNKLIVQKMHEVAVNKKGRSILSWDTAMNNHVLRLNGVDYPMEKFTAKFQYIHATGSVDSMRYEVFGNDGERMQVMHSQGLLGGHYIKMLMPLGIPDARGIMKIIEDPAAKIASLSAKKRWRLTPVGWIEEEKTD
ncbi:MAG: restriction endonuclease [Isosphaeraceae bacterium]|jgi:hypothetical protein